MDTLSKIDPNTVLQIVGGLFAIGLWIYHKAKGDGRATLADTLVGVMRNVLGDLLPTLSQDSTQSELRAMVTSLAWTGLERAGVPRNGISETLVNAAIEHTIADAMIEVRKLASDQKSIDTSASQLAAAAKSLLATMASPEFQKGLGPITGPNITELK